MFVWKVNNACLFDNFVQTSNVQHRGGTPTVESTDLSIGDGGFEKFSFFNVNIFILKKSKKFHHLYLKVVTAERIRKGEELSRRARETKGIKSRL